MGLNKEEATQWKPSWVQTHHLSREPWLVMYLTPQPSRMSHFSPTMSSNSSTLNFVKPTSLRCGSSGVQGMWTWPCIGPELHASCSAIWCVNVHDDLANANPGHCALGLSKGPSPTCLMSSLGTTWGQRCECTLERAVSKVP